MEGSIKMRMDLAPLKRLAKESPEKFNKAMKKGAIQFLTWANTGSAKSSKKPPIRWGVLRGSSSAFVGGELVATQEQTIKAGSPDRPEPVRLYSGDDLVATFIWNTPYAARMHEWMGDWGEFTTQDGDAGSKWLEEHLKQDRDDLMKMISIEFKKESGM